MEKPERVRPKRQKQLNESLEKAHTSGSFETKSKSSFAGTTRNPSEDSKNIRFVDRELGTDIPRRHDSWKKSLRRRMSRMPVHPVGLTRIRVPGNLNYTEIRQKFERQSTFHGISHAALAPSDGWRYFWYSAFGICAIALGFQIILLVTKYKQYHKTVDLDLKFENAPFPSITLCNLNPYKKSAVNNNPSTKSMMEAYSKRIAGGGGDGLAAALASHLQNRVKREKRKAKKRRRGERRYHQVFAQCLCDIDPLTGDRKGSCFAAHKGKVYVDVENSLGHLHPSRCLCQLDMISRALWPCFPYGTWKEKLCSECVDSSGHCPMRFYKGNEKYDKIKDQVDICLCHKEYNHCVSNNDDGVILEIDPSDELGNINITAKTQLQLEKQQRIQQRTTTTEAPEVTEALGFENITSDIAIAAQAQQNLMFAVEAMTPTEKKEMSHQLDEFVLKCSFNQKDCNMETDFKLHYDNTYGNCYTFNHDRFAERSSHRAGANYGLRVILYADVSEYLPTSEAVGFRITVHDKFTAPFPDAFGYSAPTGFLSSYGVRMKQFIRLEPPYGHCKPGGEDNPDYIYTGFHYSVEACHRSCAQKLIIDRCGCGDPMFPLPRETEARACQATDKGQRECLRNATLFIGEQTQKGKEEVAGCYCHQPCSETNYEVTYSAARWPSGAGKVLECVPGDYLCMEKYRKNAAMIQIFYEELNYETLREEPAYTLTSLLADLGGVTGLWIGASVVSLLEIVALIIFTSQAFVRNRKGSLSSGSLHNIRKLSNRLSVLDLRSIKSNHSSRSVIIEEFPAPIMEQLDDEESESGTNTSNSCRYLAPGEELPCLCKFNDMGNIVVMKALCPVHGYMVRRGYDFSVSNSEDENDEDDGKEHQYFAEPYTPRKSQRRKKQKNKSTSTLDKEEVEQKPNEPRS